MFKSPISFIQESSSVERESERSLNIIVLQPDHILFLNHDNSEHRKRMETGTYKQIESDPRVQGKMPQDMLDSLDKRYISRTLSYSVKALNNLRQLCERHSAKLVIATDHSEMTLEQQQALYSLAGLGEYIIGTIPELKSSYIEEWLAKHSRKMKSFIIIDGYDHDLNRFTNRHLRCNKLFESDETLSTADLLLQQPLQFEKSNTKRLMDAIKNDSLLVTDVTLQQKEITELRINCGWDRQTCLDNIFAALAKNHSIKRLNLTHFCMDRDISDSHISNGFLQQVADLLQSNSLHLDYLNLANNLLQNFDSFLNALDGNKIHIPHICLNRNPLATEAQKKLSAWIKSYPKPILIDLDISGSGWGRYPLDASIIDAIAANPNITVRTDPKLFSAIFTKFNREEFNNLISSGRIISPEGEKLERRYGYF